MTSEITQPCVVKFAVLFEILQILVMISTAIMISVLPETRNRFGAFYYVSLSFIIVFLACSGRVLQTYREMRTKSLAIDSIRFNSQTN